MDGVGKDTNRWKGASMKMGKKDSFWRKLYELLHWLDYPKDTLSPWVSAFLSLLVDVLAYATYFYLAYPALEIIQSSCKVLLNSYRQEAILWW